jgi:hypothetical protein
MTSMTINEKTELNSFRVASKILEKAGVVVNNDEQAKLHAQLENIIKTMEMEEVENIKTEDSVDYFDFGLVLEKIKEKGDTPKLTEIVETAVNEQVESWLAKLANLVNTKLVETMCQLEELHSTGRKVSNIKNHPDFHFLSGYLARFSEETELSTNY